MDNLWITTDEAASGGASWQTNLLVFYVHSDEQQTRRREACVDIFERNPLGDVDRRLHNSIIKK